MFTGIVERTVHVATVSSAPGFVRLNLAVAWSDVKPGESVAINGVCLTVAEITPMAIGFDVIPETLSKTNLGLLKAGDTVNVERSLRAGDRIDGHFVQGHIDARGEVTSVRERGASRELMIRVPKSTVRYIAPKGSITVNGVSLTVTFVRGGCFGVALVSYTLKHTNLGALQRHNPVNVETDLIARYLARLIGRW